MQTPETITAIARSISHGENVRIVVPNVDAAMSSLKELGLEGDARKSDDSIECWGSYGGAEWRVRLAVDVFCTECGSDDVRRDMFGRQLGELCRHCYGQWLLEERQEDAADEMRERFVR